MKNLERLLKLKQLKTKKKPLVADNEIVSLFAPVIERIKGESTPTEKELVKLIKPLIPKPIPGKDGKTPSHSEVVEVVRMLLSDIKHKIIATDDRIISLIRPLIPEPVKGDKGDSIKGDMPKHKWQDTKLSFEKPDGSWGEAVDLKGPIGETVKTEVTRLGGNVTGGKTMIKNSGTTVTSAASFINFGSGLTATADGSGVNVVGTGEGGIADGDKGDITVSDSGVTWTIDNDTIGLDELSATGTPDTSTFLRGDNTWAVPAGSGAVDSVNAQTGVVVLDADDIDDTATIQKFTTAADISKLSGIESGADVTDTANVTAAGALMDSELADITAVKTLQAPDNTTISTFGASLTDDADAATARNTLGLGTLATQSGTFSGTSSGTNTGDNATNSQYSGLVSNATHTGDVTGATALTIANDAVTNAKMANMATKTYKGRTTAGTGDPEDVSVATLKTDLVLVKGDVGLGNVDNTSDATKRIKRVVTTTDDATAVIDTDVTDVYELSAVANATTFTLTGTPTDGQQITIRFKDAGVPKALTWTGFTEIGVTLPTTTVTSKWHYVGIQYNSVSSQWHVLSVTAQA